MKILASNKMKNWRVTFDNFMLELTVTRMEEKNRFKVSFEAGSRVVTIKTYNLDRCLKNIENFGNEYIKRVRTAKEGGIRE